MWQRDGGPKKTMIINPINEAGTIDINDRADLAAQAEAFLKKGGGRFFKAGGLWIYDNEIDRVSGSFTDGDLLSVRDHDGYFLGYGFINRASTIRIRMMSRSEDEPVSTALLYRRVKDAWEYRKKVIDTSSCPASPSTNTRTCWWSNRWPWARTA